MTSSRDQSSDLVITESDDPLLQCLLLIGKLNDRVLSKESLRAGLPLVDNKLTPQLFIRSAKRAGFSAKLVSRSIQSIPTLVYPVVLLLKNNRACILIAPSSGNKYEVVFPEAGEGLNTVSLEELQENYLGYAIFVKPSLSFEKRLDEYTPKKEGHWFWSTLLLFKKVYLNVGLAALCINIFALTSSLYLMNVYDRVVPNNAVETLWTFSLGVAIIYTFDFFMRYFRSTFIDRVGKRADILMASKLFQHTLGLPVSSKPGSTGAFANNLKGYDNLRDFFTSATMTAVIDVPFAILFLAVIFMIGGYVGFIPLIAIIIIFVYSLFFQSLIQKSVSKAYIGASQKHSLLVEAIMGFETVKGLCAEGLMQRKMEKLLAINAEDELESRYYSNIASNITIYIQQMVIIILVIVCVYSIKAGNMTMGGMIACIILAGRAIGPLATIATILTRMQQSVEALHGLNKIMEMPQERSEKKEFLHRSSFRPELQFIEASFAYPNQPTLPVLKKITLSIHEGEKVAILGRIGSGKSTLLKLMLGFYYPIEGSVLINGIDSRQIDPVDLRRNIGYIGQDETLFNGTVRENIMMAAPWASEKTFLEACQLAGVDTFTSETPQGYDLNVGERGNWISGGQRQAICAARAFINKPSLLLFDEPTSAMDNSSEKTLLTCIKGYTTSAERTLVIATHKFALLELVDRVIVIEQGYIIADGPRDVILSKLTGGK